MVLHPAQRRRGAVAFLLTAMCTLSFSACSAQSPSAETVDVIQLEGLIDPPTASYLVSKLQQAEEDGVQAAVIEIDTPGGLRVSMSEIVEKILDSEVPIISWVAPRGARAASTGTFIVHASNLAFMAESTEIGAATPINLAGANPDPKVTNDAVAFIRELAVTRGRNPEWAEDAVRDGATIEATEAADIDVVDGTASSLADLLEQIDGTDVETADGSSVVLETWDESEGVLSAPLRFQNPNLLQQLLHLVTDPEFAFLLLLVGAYGLIFEVYNPGIGLAAILGAASLLLGFYGLSVLPTNWAGVFLILLGVALFIVDLQMVGLGLWTAGGLAALISGSILLFAGVDESLRLSPWAIGAAVALTLLFFISVMTAALRVRLRRPITGEEALVGAVGEAKTDIAPEGTVMTKGTMWRARTMEMGIAEGAQVRVMATEGLVLLVEPVHEAAQTSADGVDIDP
ncbi:MAG: nodulation protein NfeD [Actinomycetota bacterium]|nr:nodulation protein NfeD [Actinomycetota bacterium]